MAICLKHGAEMILTPDSFHLHHCEKCVQEETGFDHSMTTPAHLRAQAAQLYAAPSDGWSGDAIAVEADMAINAAVALEHAADTIDLLTARVAELEGALREMAEMYSHAWDRADGDLTMIASSVIRFDEACRKARIALGEPLYGDNGESDEEPLQAAAQGDGT